MTDDTTNDTGAAEALRGAHDHEGRTLESLSRERPLLLVFLRHFG